jgi:hypothetical protein
LLRIRQAISGVHFRGISVVVIPLPDVSLRHVADTIMETLH